jgi:hypothetical protein
MRTPGSVGSGCVADGANGQVYILSRSDGRKLGAFGRYAGEFKWVHNIDVDSEGNLYTAEVGYGTARAALRSLRPTAHFPCRARNAARLI